MSLRESKIQIRMLREGTTPHGGKSHLSALNNQRPQKLVPLTRQDADKGEKKENTKKSGR